MLDRIIGIRQLAIDKAERAVALQKKNLNEAKEALHQVKEDIIEFAKYKAEKEVFYYEELIGKGMVKKEDIDEYNVKIEKLIVKVTELEEKKVEKEKKCKEEAEKLVLRKQDVLLANRAKEKFIEVKKEVDAEAEIESQRKEEEEADERTHISSHLFDE